MRVGEHTWLKQFIATETRQQYLHNHGLLVFRQLYNLLKTCTHYNNKYNYLYIIVIDKKKIIAGNIHNVYMHA